MNQSFQLSIDDKREMLSLKYTCFVCLRAEYTSRNCISNYKCTQCNDNHVILMCSVYRTSTVENSAEVYMTKVSTDICTFTKCIANDSNY